MNEKRAKKEFKKVINTYYSVPGNTWFSSMPQSDGAYLVEQPFLASNNTPEMSLQEREDFMNQKKQDGERSKQENLQYRYDILAQGTVTALTDHQAALRKQRKEIRQYGKEYHSDHQLIEKLYLDLQEETNKNAKLEKRLSKVEKQCKKLDNERKDMEKILSMMSNYLGVSGKNAPIRELAATWKHFRKIHKSCKNYER